MIYNVVTIGNTLKQMNATNLELNFQLDIYRSKSWKFTKIYITILETSRLLLADVINIIAQV